MFSVSLNLKFEEKALPTKMISNKVANAWIDTVIDAYIYMSPIIYFR